MDKNEGAFIPLDVLTLERAAHFLDCSPRILANKVRNGELAAYKRLGRWYLFTDDVKTWLRSGEKNNGKKVKKAGVA